MRLNTLIRRVERVRGEVRGMVREACEGERGWIVEANRGQLREGVNAEGEMMNGGVYSATSVRQRAKRGLPTDHVYLSFEGDLQERMDVVFGDEGFAIVSTDWKQRLVDEAMRTGWWPSRGNAPEYGPVFGLTAGRKGELSRRIWPAIARRVRNRVLSGR